jgi:general secretion pathway protein H
MTQRGFTLIELLVSIAIVSLMIAAVPVLFGGGLTGTTLKAGARQMAGELRRARSRAIFENDEIGFAVDAETGHYVVVPNGRGGTIPGGASARLTAPGDDDAPAVIVFYPDGSSSGGRLTLARDERRFDIDVDWLTGRVQLAE